MLKPTSIATALTVFLAGAAHAQQREAVLRKIELPGLAFNLILAVPKPAGTTFDLSESPDALLLHLAGGELALGFEREDAMLKALEALQAPSCAPADSKASRSRMPVAVYFVPKDE